ncbi:M81 family metallopeptidase [Aneurinibacillus sp. Ricciae_BoGa-3]|uniref:M81 family metallopeptidase n=1 Tax=Aneurinibacillus sp. Ricciae_BoGa-3 TaxID=3022697 RepID=UPI00233FBF78|nr:M81 family metallopeptidase [Aneurinibacillus sp. Ricciae_BoGa-3]WCK52359.1 M81 family metallopeptidase [Aneurinibacillus sp. Ricciae_BoGa-3]
MRIAIGQIAHETNTFSTVKTTVDVFKSWEWDHGQEILERHDNVKDYLGGMIDQCNQLGIKVAPTFSAFAGPSGIITNETFEILKNELLSSIHAAGELDGICLALHGAGVAEGIDDLEGSLLEELRKIVGYEIPIVVTLDLHSNITQKMIQTSNALLGVNFYPHTDSYERGLEAVGLIVQMIEGKINPVMHLVNLPLLIPTSTTYQSPSKDINEICWQWEKNPNIIDCTFFHGFPYTDIPNIGVSVLTITNGDIELAEKASENVAQIIWQKKDEFAPSLPSPEEGIKQSLAIEGNLVVVNETSDNPGAGTPGDGTYLLKALIEENAPNTCFGFIYDPMVAEEAYRVGVGATIEVKLGGKTDSIHGEPLSIRGYVKSLTDGQFFQSSPMWQGIKVNLGKSVRLQVGNVDVIVCSVRSQTFDDQVFLLHGIDISKYKIVALKSSQHFRAYYQSVASAIITVDSPGLSTANLFTFQYNRLNKSVYPLDPFCVYGSETTKI